MALVRKLKRHNMDRNTVHGEADCTYTIFTDSGKKYLQIDTYGSPHRQFVGKKSQSIQFDQESLEQLKDIIRATL